MIPKNKCLFPSQTFHKDVFLLEILSTCMTMKLILHDYPCIKEVPDNVYIGKVTDSANGSRLFSHWLSGFRQAGLEFSLKRTLLASNPSLPPPHPADSTFFVWHLLLKKFFFKFVSYLFS